MDDDDNFESYFPSTTKNDNKKKKKRKIDDDDQQSTVPKSTRMELSEADDTHDDEDVEEDDGSSTSSSTKRKNSRESGKLNLRSFDEGTPILHQLPIRRPTETELAELEEAGIKHKRGKFSEKENVRIRQNFQEYLQTYGGDYGDLFGVGQKGRKIVRSKKVEHTKKEFYAKLANGLPDRHVWYVYLHARKICHPGWTHTPMHFAKEEDQTIAAMLEVKGLSLGLIGEALNRTPQSISERINRIRADKITGGITSTDLLQLLLCVSDVHKMTDLNEARRLLWSDIDWGAVARKMNDRGASRCKDMWQYIVMPDCITLGLTQVYFLACLVRQYAKDGDKAVPWDQLAKDVGLLDGFVARRHFHHRKYRLLCEKYGNTKLRTFGARKSARKIMKYIFDRKKSPKLMDENGYPCDIPHISSYQNLSQEFVYEEDD